MEQLPNQDRLTPCQTNYLPEEMLEPRRKTPARLRTLPTGFHAVLDCVGGDGGKATVETLRPD